MINKESVTWKDLLHAYHTRDATSCQLYRIKLNFNYESINTRLASKDSSFNIYDDGFSFHIFDNRYEYAMTSIIDKKYKLMYYATKLGGFL